MLPPTAHTSSRGFSRTALGIAIANSLALVLMPDAALAACGQHSGSYTTTKTCNP